MQPIRKLKRVRPLKKPKDSKLDLDKIDRPILFIEGVARMLGCSVDHVRRIPNHELPRCHGIGKRALFLRFDVVRYVEKKIREENPDDDLNFMESSKEADLLADEIRRRDKN